MSKATQTSGSAGKRWALAGAIGVLTLIFVGAVAGHGWGAAIFLALLTAVLLGLVFNWLYGVEPPALAEHAPARMVGAGTVSAARAPDTVTARSGNASPSRPEPAAPARPAAEPDTDVAAEDDVADARDEVSDKTDADAPRQAAAPAKPAAEKAEPKQATAATGTSEVEAQAGPAADATKSDAEPAPGAAGASEVAADVAGERPRGLKSPRKGGADDLKKIKGVGPKLAEVLNDHGIYHYDQVAAWGPAEVAWMDENLKGFRGRVTRDGWVEQAKTLAAGGTKKE
ncbi:endonuclease [Aquicoccus sp. SCR17]|nr:endonuclease [Carideicomes alvinocaridis]